MRLFLALVSWIRTRSPRFKVVMLMIMLVIGGWGMHRIASSKPAVAELQTSRVTKGTLVLSLSSAGTVTAANSRSITTTATGVVKKIFAKNGEMIQSGSPLLELDLDQESKQTYSQAAANYQTAKNNVTTAQTAYYTIQADMLDNWDTYKELAESETYKDTSSATRALPEFIIPQNTWLASEAKYKQQQAVVAQAQTTLSSAALALRNVSPTLYAPISGTVNGLSLQVGSVLSPNGDSTVSNAKIANIITPSKPVITINVTEADVTKIKIGDKATITADALGEITFTGSVISIDTVGSTSSGVTSYPTVVQLDTEVPLLYPSMSVTAQIITTTKDNVLLIPSSAISTANGISTVQVLKNGMQQMTTIETGLASDTQTEVVSGLNEGDAVVMSAAAVSKPASNPTGTSVFSGLGGAGGMRIR